MFGWGDAIIWSVGNSTVGKWGVTRTGHCTGRYRGGNTVQWLCPLWIRLLQLVVGTVTVSFQFFRNGSLRFMSTVYCDRGGAWSRLFALCIGTEGYHCWWCPRNIKFQRLDANRRSPLSLCMGLQVIAFRVSIDKGGDRTGRPLPCRGWDRTLLVIKKSLHVISANRS